ncbi:MAG: ABC transporter substrate-binding protein [Thaumarchaeota archaeon]|nr:ABC transporter substrate-binding protein [Nitrososphaerota archaeon]
MKSRKLLSVVLSLIMVLGVTVGSVYAQTDNEIDLDDRLDKFCNMTNEGKHQFFADHPRLEQFANRLANYCELSAYERTVSIQDFVREHIDEARDYDIRNKLDRYCEMTDEEKRDLISKYDKAEDHVDRMNSYCELDENERDTYIEEHKAKFRMNHDKDIRGKLARYCEMTDEEKQVFLAEHEKAEDHADRMNAYCELDEDARIAFIEEHRDEYKSHMKDKMDKVKGKHLDYDRLCALSESDRILEFDDSEKLERISNWCNMTIEEREEFKKEHHDIMKEKRQDAVNRIQENPNIPQRIKVMIMDTRDISNDRLDEIRMKYEEKYGDFDEKKSELKIKFKNYMATIEIKMSEERKSAIKDRVAEMKAFKIDLREKSSELSDEEKQGLRAEFIETAKDIRLAWISPRHQMNAGIDAAEIECREGYSLLMKESNGVAMCLKADTALKMIERGIAVPAI